MSRPADLVKLVSNVEAYPEFINLLSAVRVTDRESIGDGVERFEAQAMVSYKFIREQFHSVVTVDHGKNTINVAKADRSGAVKDLKNEWVFHELSDGSSLVDFFVKVSLKAFPLELMLRDKFDRAGEHIMKLFEVKASQTFPVVGDPDLNLKQELERLGLRQSLV